MKKLKVLIGLGAVLFCPLALAEVSDAEIQALRAQVEALTRRLDELERQNQAMSRSLQQAERSAANTALPDAPLPNSPDPRIVEAVTEHVDASLAAVSWAERLRWKGDFRYRYENIGVEGQDDRNRSRIRARTHLEAQVSPTVEVGVGLSTGGDDPVSSNVTIGGGGSRKDIGLDLAYFDWSGLAGTHVLGGKFANFLVSPQKSGLLWDGDWRPEGLGVAWQNGTYFAQGLGTWLEGDSSGGTEFAWIAQAGVNLALGSGKLTFGAGYSQFDIAGQTPLYGEPDDFFGNSYVLDPLSGALVFAHDYHEAEAFAEYRITLGGRPLALFADYVVNTEASANDTGYLFGARYGSAKARGTWDLGWFYEKLEADATVGLLTDSDFGGGGTDAKGHAFSGTYAFHDNWNFKLTYFLNEIELASGKPRDFDRLMLDLNFKYK
jgi:outer membrane murein-binding lipoprotein Lpp